MLNGWSFFYSSVFYFPAFLPSGPSFDSVSIVLLEGGGLRILLPRLGSRNVIWQLHNRVSWQKGSVENSQGSHLSICAKSRCRTLCVRAILNARQFHIKFGVNINYQDESHANWPEMKAFVRAHNGWQIIAKLATWQSERGKGERVISKDMTRLLWQALKIYLRSIKNFSNFN